MDKNNFDNDLLPFVLLGIGSVGSLVFLYWLVYYLTA